jgi:Glycosyl transferase family 90
LSLEGNDVASGLKWMLYSNSVVLMPRPTRVAWAMEDQLVPWYHYIPVKDDLSDLPALIQWARSNDDKCQQIAQHATQYIDQLYASKEARRKNKWLHQQIVKRYTAQFGNVLANCSIE